MSQEEKKEIEVLVKDLCLIPGLSGYEDGVRLFLQEKLKINNINYTSDLLGNLIVTLPGNKNYPSVMLFAHMDQLGFVVKKIEDNGMIRIERVGGVSEKALASQEVVIISKNGKKYFGVIGNKSHHATTQDEKYLVLSYKEMFVDAGFETKKEVELQGINIGSPITFSPKIKNISENCLVGTAIDDRAGCAVILEVAKAISSDVNRPTVHIVFSVQEEFNLRGVLPVAQTLLPDMAIQIDLMLASDTPDMKHAGDIHLGKGPCMSMYSFHGRGTLNGVIPHPKLVNHIENVALKSSIHLQRSATTGILTDSSYVQLVDKGIAVIDMGFPMRYSHSSNEVCDLRDLVQLKKLLILSIKCIDESFSLSRD